MRRNGDDLEPSERRDRRLRRRRRRKRVYLRSVYSLPSLATLGNAICGFGAIYVAAMPFANIHRFPGASYFDSDPFLISAYLIFFAMLFDALDGRLARFTRHTTDFGGQLDSLADAISFGVAPAFLALELFKGDGPTLPESLNRAIWAVGALYVACALLRLARFNVSNQHGEQHHFSFLGLPSPAAAALVASFVLMQQDLRLNAIDAQSWLIGRAADICTLVLPFLVLIGGLLMVSTVRYPHLVNRYLRGRRSVGRIIFVLVLLLLVVIAHRYTIAIGVVIYVIYGLFSSIRHLRRAKQSHA
ncbi:MAG TPA: CDP-diacylglycerol--serine O-phosphatidyltransferase [Tepidisphaeraceae bacterium]|nr:CDP-diacylglycerol--serine O-phosphatidyltransferase [Tepidisphaeraceae bacterium]